MCDLETSRMGAPYIYIYIYIYDISRLRVKIAERDTHRSVIPVSPVLPRHSYDKNLPVHHILEHPIPVFHLHVREQVSYLF